MVDNGSSNPNFDHAVEMNTAQLAIHAERLNWIINDNKELHGKIEKLENRYDAIYEMASSIKTMSVQIDSINTNVTDMKSEFKNDIADLKTAQQQMSSKMTSIESSTDEFDTTKKKREKIRESLISEVAKYIFLILVAIILVTLFPNIKDFL